jgi:hypothetical protein
MTSEWSRLAGEPFTLLRQGPCAIPALARLKVSKGLDRVSPCLRTAAVRSAAITDNLWMYVRPRAGRNWRCSQGLAR